MHLEPREIDIWLPPSYGSLPDARFPVLYMHDGQNLFDPEASDSGKAWRIDEAITRLAGAGRIREAIVVGVWSSPAHRREDYMPRKPVQAADPAGGDGAPPAGKLSSDAYVEFLVGELKPSIDAQYRTLPGRDDTFVMGSSMGGLVSLYAAAEHPDVFGGVGAISPHWPAGDGVVIEWLACNLPDPASHRLYFDHGTRTLDARYGRYQERMDEALRRAGYREGANWLSYVFPGDAHDEDAWRHRVHAPLEFLLGTPELSEATRGR